MRVRSALVAVAVLGGASGAGAAAKSASGSCAPAALALVDLGTVHASDLAGTATTTFAVRDLGEPCLLSRIATVRAFDASGNAIDIAGERLRELSVVLKVHLSAAAPARFTIVSPSTGTPCTRVARLRLTVGNGAIEAPASFFACTAPDGTAPRVSLVMGAVR